MAPGVSKVLPNHHQRTTNLSCKPPVCHFRRQIASLLALEGSSSDSLLSIFGRQQQVSPSDGYCTISGAQGICGLCEGMDDAVGADQELVLIRHCITTAKQMAVSTASYSRSL